MLNTDHEQYNEGDIGWYTLLYFLQNFDYLHRRGLGATAESREEYVNLQIEQRKKDGSNNTK